MKKGIFLSIFLFSVVSFASTDDLSWVKQEKIRAYWGPPVELIEPLHDAGFNVVIKRLELAVNDSQYSADKTVNAEGYNFEQAEQELKDSSALCKKLGMRYFACLNVGAIAPMVNAGFENNPRRHHNGKLPCPLDEVYWNRVIINRFNKIIDILSGPQYRLDGLMIDPEMYYFGGSFLSLPCYCKWCAADFIKGNPESQVLADSNLVSSQQWLKENNLLQAYDAWQFAKSHDLAKQLEYEVHSKMPNLVLGFLIYEKTPWFDAVANGLSGDRMPLMIGTEMQTYSGAYDGSYLEYQQTLAKQVPVPFINCPGIWINANSEGQVPERLLSAICGNLYYRTILADGYFVYASDRWGGTAEKAKPFTDVFKKINAELDIYLNSKGSYKSSLLPRALPVESPGNLQSLLENAQNWQLIGESIGGVSPLSILPHLRETEGQKNTIIFKAKQGDTIRITMNTIQLGNYIDKGSMAIFGPDANNITDIFCDYNKSVSCDITATQTGAYAVVATAYSNSYAVGIKGVPWVITGQVVNLNRVGGRLYFYVPKNMETLSASFGGGGEGADFILYDPQGLMVHSKKAVREPDIFELPVADKSGVWSVEINNIEDDISFSIKGIDRYAVDAANLMFDKD